MKELTVKQKQYLKGLAHELHPVVMIGINGLTQSVLKEIIANLEAHELIKIKVLSDDRSIRDEMIELIAKNSGASFVQHIGKLLIFYKANAKQRISLPN